MRKDFTGIPGSDWHLAGGTYHFSGPPDDCTGTLSVVNHSDQRIRIRRLQTVQPSRSRKGFTPLTQTRIRLRTTVAPNSDAEASARLELPDNIAPGRYLALLKTGDEKITLEVEVEATRRLELDPEEHLLVGRAAEPVSFRVDVLNAGNVPVNILPMMPVWLLEEDWNQRVLVSVLQESGDTDDFATVAQRLLERARQDIPAPAEVQASPAPPLTLAPGDTTTLTLSLTLPENLAVGREYAGHVRINEERVDLEVYCEGPAAHPNMEPPAVVTNN